MTDSSDALSEQVAPEEAVTRQVRATSAMQRQPATYTPAEAAVITAELPVQRASAPPLVRRSVEPVSNRREPAPALLQVLVWLLALLFLIVVIGTIVALASPNSMSFLRNSTPASVGSVRTGIALVLG
jgi:hypothetical protein